VDARARRRGRHAQGEQHAGGGQPVGHADGAVDHLRREAHGGEHEQVLDHGRAPVRRRPWCPMPRAALRRAGPGASPGHSLLTVRNGGHPPMQHGPHHVVR
jgi:hypothetical protein